MTAEATSFDAAMLEELHAIGAMTPAFFGSLSESFASSSRESVAKIRDACRAADHDGLYSAAHALKGCSATFGAARLAARAAELEQQGRLKSAIPPVDALLDLDGLVDTAYRLACEWAVGKQLMAAPRETLPEGVSETSPLAREAIRVYGRYEVEVIEAFTLCPWAERSRREGHTRQLVLDGPLDADLALAAIDVLAADARVEVGFLLFPCCTLPRVEFERFVSRLRERDQQRGAAFMAAAFHPDAPADLSDPYRLVPFIRRSPDPTIQLIRRSVLDSVRRPGDGGSGYIDPASITDLAAFFKNLPKPPLHERVAQANLEQIERVSVALVEQVLVDIRADRARGYAAVLGADHPAVGLWPLAPPA